eukprot:TRINITY_DN563_c2_g1_i1.p1 TRINITY_DN563_c2_g1~~TRINITY_DN563_c2_g1_i1.p1  ORF type:complete len:343 (-),score=76.14 TRINITY_DN563_c2_g1_i1:270-1298(-)
MSKPDSSNVPKQFDGSTTAEQVVTKLNGDHLVGRSIIVTGANAGFGFETALALARSDVSVVVVAARREDAGKEAVSKIIETVNDAEKANEKSVVFMKLDLGSFVSIEQFAEEFSQGVAAESPLYALVCNAGSGYRPFSTTTEGYETTFGVNHLGHFYLFKKLLPAIRAGTPKVRVVVTSSESHMEGQCKFRASDMTASDETKIAELRKKLLLDKNTYGTGHVQYGASKRCNNLFSNEIQRRYGKEGITSIVLHPASMVNTSFGVGIVGFLMSALSWFTRTPQQGAATQTMLAVLDDVQNLGGMYFDKCQLCRQHEEAEDHEIGRLLWELSDQLVDESLEARK